MISKADLVVSLAIVLIVVAASPNTSSGRGFGGMHGGMGGMRGGMGGGMGGMRGGMGGMGSMRGGMGGGTGGMRGGMGSGMSGMRGGMGGMGSGMSGMRGGMGGMGGMSAMRGGMGGMGSMGGGMGGMRGGMGGMSAMGVGGMNGMRGGMGGMAGAGRFPGGAARGFGGAAGRVPGGFGARPNRQQLGNFLGLPSDAGMHALAGNHLGLDQRGIRRMPDTDMRLRGDDLRRDFRPGDFYSRDWYRRYAGAWYPRRWAYGDVWAAADWAAMSSFCGYGSAQPTYYDYGNNVNYQGDSVYVDGQDVGTSDQYYQQAADLASTGTQAQTTDDTEWMPLGVFAMTNDQHTQSNLILQLAVNKDGIIRGNYTATMTNDTKPIQGSVDKKTQRAAWTIGDNKDNVIETGIYNLTKDEAPALVHFGKDKTEQWVLVRLNKDQDQGQDQPAQTGL